MAVATIHSDFGAQEEEICHYFHLFPLHLQQFLNNNHTFSNNYFWKEKKKSDYSYLNMNFNSIQSQLKHSILSKM